MFGILEKISVWQKGTIILGHDSNEWRADFQGKIIRFSDHGDRNSNYGWEIGHIVDRAFGGNDHISNLRP